MTEVSVTPRDVVDAQKPDVDTTADGPTQTEVVVNQPDDETGGHLEQPANNTNSDSTPPEDTTAERVARVDREREIAIMTVIRSAAVNVHRQHESLLKEDKPGLKNPAELVFARLGYLLTIQERSLTDPPVLQDDSKNKPGIYWPKNSPMPRVLPDGRIIADRRAGASDTVSQSMVAGERQIYQLRGKERDTKTGHNSYTFTTLDSSGKPDGSAVTWDENTVIKAFLVANTQILAEGLQVADGSPTAIAPGSILHKPEVRQIVDKVIGNCQEFYRYEMNTVRKRSDLQVDIAKNVDVSAIERGIEPVSLSKASAAKLGSNMAAYMEGHKQDYGDRYDRDSAQVQEITSRVQQGFAPTAEDVYTLLRTVGRPGLERRLSQVSAEISQLESTRRASNSSEAVQKSTADDLLALRTEEKYLKELLHNAEGSKNNHLFVMLKDIEEGRANPDLVQRLNGLLGDTLDPDGIFRLSKMDKKDKDSLIHLLVDHFGEKLGDDKDKAKAWILEFISKYKGEIGLMFIYALINISADAVKSGINNK